MIPSFMMEKTILFFKDLLQFEPIFNSGNYVILSKNDLTLHLLTAGEDIGQMEFYLEVDDINSIWIYIKDKLGQIKHKSPHDREYGMREIHIAVPGTNTLLFIGQEI